MSSQAALSLRIVSADYYSAPPNPNFDETYNHFRSSVIKQVPVIRIFGIAPTGEKACAHIHGVFPYIYVPLPNSTEGKGSVLYEVAQSLDEALNSSFGSKKHHVFKITKVSAIPFYGYHSKEKDFLKIEFYHPSSVKRSVTLLQSGAIASQVLQPHEAHLSFILQFFINYNLYGMNFLHLSQCTLRVVHNSDSPGPSTTLTRVSKCFMEFDATSSCILNPQCTSRVLNPGLSDIREEEEKRHVDDGVPLAQPSQEESRNCSPTSSDVRFREQLEEALRVRQQNELTNSQSTSSQPQAQVNLDNLDVSVLKVLFNRVVGEEEPDADSILGFTPEDNPEEPEPDLSQPYVSFVVDSDEENAVGPGEVDLSETLVWPELDGLSQIHYDGESPPIFVDGNMDDDDKTPEKVPRKSKRLSSPRYAPLNVKLYKSPKGNKPGNTFNESQSSPELFERLEKEVSKLRDVKSPLPKQDVQPKASTSSEISDDVDIIADSDTEDNATGNRKKRRTRRVLFKKIPSCSSLGLETSQYIAKPKPSLCNSTKETRSIETDRSKSLKQEANAPKDKESTEAQTLLHIPLNVGTVVVSRTKTSPEATKDDKYVDSLSQMSISTNEDVTLANDDGLTSKNNLTEPVNIDTSCCDLDTTNFSQSSVISFYGDTTMFTGSICFDDIIITPVLNPPTPEEIIHSLPTYRMEKVVSEEPFFGNPKDVSSSKEVGFDIIKTKSKFPQDLEEFKGNFFVNWPLVKRSKKKTVILQPVVDPPSPGQVARDLEILSQTCSISQGISQNEGGSQGSQPILQHRKPKPKKEKKKVKIIREFRPSGEIEHASGNNSGLFKLDFQNLQDAQKTTLHKYTTVMIVELHACTRGDLKPDPEYDGVEALFYTIVNDVPSEEYSLEQHILGIILVGSENEKNRYPFDCKIDVVSCEKELFSSLVSLVDFHDPDIIAGYEIEMLSWGYLIERGYVLGLNLMTLLSRIRPQPEDNQNSTDKFSNKDYELRIPGRIVLNVWRLMRYEVALMSYSFENVAYHVLHTRIPTFSFKTLTYWWNHLSKKFRGLVLRHYLTLVDGTEKILDQLNLVGRTCELASLFGIQFYEVFSRGSQFRVESMMLRLAKRLGFIAVSPSVEQRAHMRAPECLPLIMEPESRFYSDPVIVLDFQSLYPSMMIAYNYCFSTCLGRVQSLMESSDIKFGCTDLNVPLKELINLQKKIHVSPTGIAFVDRTIRHGVLPQMLAEILDTRIMVKSSMKRHKKDKLLSRVLDARQLGLKLIANVTYGYTSANFSGRMPCIEVGDSVVSKGRETLERAIRLVETEREWRARVVYGDTDSLFVLCPGRTRAEAFAIGQEIADRVTKDNPPPVKLKLEKVYQPCILQTKKRYVGFMYESPDQKTPTYEAKGIETVRRDGCPAASKILEKSLKLLFETKDLSVVKEYVSRQMMKVLSGRLNPMELTFAKEYRGIHGYTPNAPVPALKIAKEMLDRDRRGEPRSSERVPYVIVCGPPGVPLISLARSLPDYLANPAYVLNADYYISKAILPPLARCLTLLGVDVFSWYSSLPKKQLSKVHQTGQAKRKATIAQYFKTVQCLACGKLTPLTLCESCRASPSHTLTLLSQMVRRLERKDSIFKKICESCCSRNYEADCVSLDCPIFYRRTQAANDKMQTSVIYTAIDELSLF